jgi:uncharacterized protein YqeY
MSVIDQINADLKTAMLARDSGRTEALKGIKTALQYAEVEARAVGQSLDEAKTVAILQKEAKKRTESAELYQKAGSQDRADKELAEKAIIDAYLPAQLNEAELSTMIDDAAAQAGGLSQQTMGQVIGAVKAKAGVSADGAIIARLVKDRLNP